MSSGCISEEEYNSFAESFIRMSNIIGDNWEVRKYNKQMFLYKRTVQPLYLSIDKSPSDRLVVEDEGEDEDELSLTPDLSSDSVNVPVCCTYEYNVVFSPSYGSPVLYFNVYKTNGQLLTLEEIWQNVPRLYSEKLDRDKWTMLTQQEHPILGRPYFQLHPCHTADLMKQAPWKKCGNYLITWLSTVGPVVGLSLPLSYADLTTSKGCGT